MSKSRKLECLKNIVDVVLLLVVAATVFLVKKLWPRFERGMFCNDEALNYPYKDYDTISDTILILYGFVMTILVMCVVEFVQARRKYNIRQHVTVWGKRFSSWFGAVYPVVIVFLFGGAATVLFTDIAKYSLGNLRPNFIAVCQPDWSKTNCSKSPYSYIDPIPCTNDDEDGLRDARQSSPSGHASVSAYTMIYLILYLQARVHVSTVRLVRPLIQFGVFVLMYYTCLTRISDYKHHWSDIFSGFLLGTSMALFVVFLVSDLFERKALTQTKGQVLFMQDPLSGTEEEQNHQHTFAT